MMNEEAELKKIVSAILTEDNLPIAVETLNIDEPLGNVGLHSISYIKLIVKLEEKFHFEMDVEGLSFNKSITIRELLATIEKSKAAN